jgi:hypothetical protein
MEFQHPHHYHEAEQFCEDLVAKDSFLQVFVASFILQPSLNDYGQACIFSTLLGAAGILENLEFCSVSIQLCDTCFYRNFHGLYKMLLLLHF